MVKRKKKAPKPQQLPLFNHGGRRDGAGRKPSGPRPLVSHTARPALAARFPVFVTTRLCNGLKSLRRPATLAVLLEAFRAGSESAGFRLVHFSIESNHLHLIVEANDAEALAAGMRGLLRRVALSLNLLWGRSGRVFADRYHTRILRSPREVRNALVYVLNNALKHGIHLKGIDPYSSGRWFDGWKGRRGRPLNEAETRQVPVAEAQTWLLRIGWKRLGLLDVGEAPGDSSRVADSVPNPVGRKRHSCPVNGHGQARGPRSARSPVR